MLAVLQFDSPSLAVLDRMLDAGRLPALAGLRGRGVWHELETPATHFAAGAFHTLYSGTELADHGLFYPFQWSAADQRVRYTTAFPAPPPVWERPGGRALAMDPYESRPPLHPPSGTVVSGWQFTDRVVLQPWSSPPGLNARLETLFGPPAAVEEVFGRSSTRDLLRLRRDLLASSSRAADAAALLLAESTYDLTWLTFSAGHVAGHQFFDLSQLPESDRAADSATRRVLGGALEEVYQSVDAAFARVLAALPEGTDVIVTSPVGMDVNTSRADLLPEMLDAVLSGGMLPDADTGSGFVWKLRAALPTGLRARVASALPDKVALALTERLELRGQDWAVTRAFAQPADNQGYVRLNLRGRERDGIVEPAEAEALMDEIASGLMTFADPDGTPAVKAVERVADTFDTGVHSDRLPDLIVRWSDRAATRLTGVVSPRFGTVHRRGHGSGRSGNHTAGDAWALVVPGASTPRTPSRPPRLVDIAATAAALAGRDGAGLPGEPLLQR